MRSMKTVFASLLLLLTPLAIAQESARQPSFGGIRALALKDPFLLFELEQGRENSARHFEGDGHLHLVNPKNHEELDIRYRDENGRYDLAKIAEIRHLLRCRLTGTEAEIPLALIELVDRIQDHFRASEVHVLSGYRSPTLNESLWRRGRRVARHSLHMQGMAMDIQLPGVPARRLRDYAKSLQSGGVGYYPQRHFVHVDVGPVRYW